MHANLGIGQHPDELLVLQQVARVGREALQEGSVQGKQGLAPATRVGRRRGGRLRVPEEPR